jgi:opacity protein-like surface antigen
VIPAAIVRQPSQIVSTALFPAARIIPPHSVYGFGVLPIGLYAEFLRHRRLHPILEGNGGILASTEPVPELGDNATGLNFIFNGGVGVRWNASQQSAVTLGYRWVHISNAETTSFNPGLDNNVFYVSYSFLR